MAPKRLTIKQQNDQAETEMFQKIGRLAEAGVAWLQADAATVQHNEDPPDVLEARRLTLLKKSEAERAEFDTRIAKAQAEKQEIIRRQQNPNPQQGQGKPHHQQHQHHKRAGGQGQKPEVVRRVEQEGQGGQPRQSDPAPLTGHMKGLEKLKTHEDAPQQGEVQPAKETKTA